MAAADAKSREFDPPSAEPSWNGYALDRATVRMEVQTPTESQATAPRDGHGNAEYTIVWACAKEAVALVSHWQAEDS